MAEASETAREAAGFGHGLASPASPARLPRGVVYVIAGVAALGLFLVFVASARPDVATAGLLLVGVTLVVCLHSLHRMVGALARDNLEVVVDTEGEYGGVSERELREERRRVLRALNELRFDHEMGKLSKADYDVVRQGFELRALEVMRALDASASLHPELAARLGVETPVDPLAQTKSDPEPEMPAAAPVAAAQAETPPAETRACAACDGANDADARFCKHCGKELAA